MPPRTSGAARSTGAWRRIRVSRLISRGRRRRWPGLVGHRDASAVLGVARPEREDVCLGQVRPAGEVLPAGTARCLRPAGGTSRTAGRGRTGSSPAPRPSSTTRAPPAHPASGWVAIATSCTWSSRKELSSRSSPRSPPSSGSSNSTSSSSKPCRVAVHVRVQHRRAGYPLVGRREPGLQSGLRHRLLPLTAREAVARQIV
jgi:hypothetical protein